MSSENPTFVRRLPCRSPAAAFLLNRRCFFSFLRRPPGGAAGLCLRRPGDGAERDAHIEFISLDELTAFIYNQLYRFMDEAGTVPPEQNFAGRSRAFQGRPPAGGTDVKTGPAQAAAPPWEVSFMLTLDKIYHAAFVLKDVARRTDLIAAPRLCEDSELYLKTENLQVTGSFKVRGAYYKISQLSEE